MTEQAQHSSTSVITASQWDSISWVLLDMDGTLLDLCFDDHFWLKTLPQTYADHHKVPLAQADRFINNIATEKYGSLEWYCIDFWSEQVGFDIRPAKQTLAHLIGFRNGALAFLKWLKHHGKHVILATNAHPDSIALKDAQTDLSQWVDHVLHAHAASAPKESQTYWRWLQEKTDFVGAQTLFIDDNDHILDAAQQAGVGYCVGVTRPNSLAEPKESRYPAFDHFQELYPPSI